MKQYQVTGMTCAACAARVEKAVNAVPGVTSCAVSLLTNSMGVEGTASFDAVITAVEAVGYGARPKEAASGNGGLADPASAGDLKAKFAAEEEALRDKESPVLIRRLLSSVTLLLVLMYFSMGHAMWNWPVPAFFHGNQVALGLLQMLLTIAVLLINQKFFLSGFRSLFHGSPNMDTLVALGAGTAFGYSLYVLFLMTRNPAADGMDHALYFESAAMIVTLITIGKLLEARSKGRTTDALKSLLRLAPDQAVLLRDGKELTVPAAQLRQGDLFIVRPGDRIPADGIVVEGSSAVDESALTGESIPVDKEAGSSVASATINQSGYLKCQARHVGEDTSLAKIIRMVSDAAASKAPIAKAADRVSAVFVPAVILIALVTIIIWLLVGQTPGFAISRGVTVLVISCPCALGLATPVAIMVGSGIGARNGILFKTAASLEAAGRTRIIALDKTGTITRGRPQVTDLVPVGGRSERELLEMAYALERRSEHPLAGAICRKAQELGLDAADVEDFRALPGNGLLARHAEAGQLAGGNEAFISKRVSLPPDLKERMDALADQGKTPLLFSAADQLIGMIAVADVLKEDSAAAIAELKKMGIAVIMVTGDRKKTAHAIGREAGVSRVIAEVLPQEKEAVIRRLQEIALGGPAAKGGKRKGKDRLAGVTMVGDGINDAPALVRADTGIAIGAGTDVAIDAADVVISGSRLLDVTAAIRLSRATLRDIRQNLFWAFFYNVILIPLAAGLYTHWFGWTMNPMIGAAAMSISSFCVVMNALRLNGKNIRNAKHDRPIKNPVILPDDLFGDRAAVQDGQANDNEKEKESMTKTLTIEGMMCPHCEASVKKALEALDQVASAEVSHEKGRAVVSLRAEIDEALLKEAVEAKDYTVTGIA